MESISSLIRIPAKSDARTSQRGEYLTSFLELINKERVGTIYKPLTIKHIATMLSKIPTQDLYAIRQEGLRYKATGKSFGQFLFGALKKHEQDN